MDLGNHRVSVWSAEGELLKEMSRTLARPRYGRDAIAFDDDGQIWIGLGQPLPRPGSVVGPRPIFARLLDTGEVVDTIFLPEHDKGDCVPRDPQRGSGYWEDVMEPFRPMLKWARGTDGTLAFGCPARFDIDVVRRDGAVMKVSRSWTPPRTSRGEQQFFAAVNEGEIPDSKPAYHRIWLTDDGRIWTWPGRPGVAIDRSNSPEGWPATTWRYYSPTDGFDVFAEDGLWLGHVETPVPWGASPLPGHRDPFIRGDSIWAITFDELSVSSVRKFVIEWEP